MHYFVGIGIPSKITGVDKAQYNRLKLFQQNGLDAKILTVQYHHLGSQFAKLHGVENDVINMYDYFQKALYIKHHHHFDYIKYWKDHPDYTIEVLRNDIDVKVLVEGKMIIYARFFDKALSYPAFINHFNLEGQFVRHEEYDIRGFLSSVGYYNNNHIVYEEYLTPTGEKVIEKYYQSKDVSAVPSAIYLKNDYGIFERFDNEDALITHFFESIHKYDDVFIIDRPLEIVPAFVNVKSSIKACVILHMTHLSEISKKKDQLKWPFVALFDNLDKFEALVCSTKAQKLDVEDYIQTYHPQSDIKVHNIPVGFVTETNKLNLEEKQPYQLISIARYVAGKNLDTQIKLAHRLKNEFPLLTLDLYGFGSEQGRLQELIHSLNAEDYIKLKGFVPHLSEVYNEATLSLLTSHSEGFALAILESLAHHTPVAAYDVKYGPSELIVDGVNGMLVNPDDDEALYDSITSFLKDDAQKKQYYINTRQSIKQYEAGQVYTQWQQLLNQLEHKGVQHESLPG